MTRLLALLLLLASPAVAEPSISVAFSPNEGAEEAVVAVIGEAKVSVLVAAYSFTSKPIAKALVEAHERGVDVRAVLDKSNATAQYSAATFLANAGIPARINSRYAIMHNKFVVVDGVTVETGSFNFTRSAGTANAENVIILRGHPEVSRQFEARWGLLWGEAEDYQRP